MKNTRKLSRTHLSKTLPGVCTRRNGRMKPNERHPQSLSTERESTERDNYLAQGNNTKRRYKVSETFNISGVSTCQKNLSKSSTREPTDLV